MHAAAYYSRTIGRVFAEGGDKNSTDSWSESTRIISNRAGIPWNEEEAVRFAFIDTFVVQSIISTVASVSREGGKTLGGLFTFVRAFKRDTRTNSISDRSYHFCIARKKILDAQTRLAISPNYSNNFTRTRVLFFTLSSRNFAIDPIPGKK